MHNCMIQVSTTCTAFQLFMGRLHVDDATVAHLNAKQSIDRALLIALHDAKLTDIGVHV